MIHRLIVVSFALMHTQAACTCMFSMTCVLAAVHDDIALQRICHQLLCLSDISYVLLFAQPQFGSSTCHTAS